MAILHWDDDFIKYHALFQFVVFIFGVLVFFTLWYGNLESPPVLHTVGKKLTVLILIFIIGYCLSLLDAFLSDSTYVLWVEVVLSTLLSVAILVLLSNVPVPKILLLFGVYSYELYIIHFFVVFQIVPFLIVELPSLKLYAWIVVTITYAISFFLAFFVLSPIHKYLEIGIRKSMSPRTS